MPLLELPRSFLFCRNKGPYQTQVCTAKAKTTAALRYDAVRTRLPLHYEDKAQRRRQFAVDKTWYALTLTDFLTR